MAWWRARTKSGESLPSERWGHTSVFSDGKMWVFGGETMRETSARGLFCFDAGALQWARVSSVSGTPPSERWGHSAVLYGRRVFVFAGFDGQEDFQDIYVLDLDLLEWSCASEALPTGGTWPCERSGHSATLVGDSMWVFGGDCGGVYFNDVWVLNLETMVWQKPDIVGTPPPERSGHSAVLHDGKIYIFGGDGGQKTYNDLHVLDPAAFTWTEVATTGAAPSPRGGHSSVVAGGMMVVFGGHGPNHAGLDTYFADTIVLDLQNLYWSKPAVPPGPSPAPRAGQSAVLHPATARVLLYGGESGGGDFFYNDVYVLDLMAAGVVPVPPSNVIPSLRAALDQPKLADIKIVTEERKSIFAHKIIVFSCCPQLEVLYAKALEEGAAGAASGALSTPARGPAPPSAVATPQPSPAPSPAPPATPALTPIPFTPSAAATPAAAAASAAPSGGLPELRIPDSYPVAFALLEFLYTGDVNEDVKTDAAIAIDLLQLAELYRLDRLAALCQQHVPRNVNVQNVAYVFRRAVAIKAGYLQDFAQHYIFTHYGNVAKTEGFWHLTNDREAMREFYTSMPDGARILPT